jgi:hypothetical protein
VEAMSATTGDFDDLASPAADRIPLTTACIRAPHLQHLSASFGFVVVCEWHSACP